MDLVVGQAVGVGGLGELGLGGVPVAEHEQGLAQVEQPYGQVVRAPARRR